MAINQISTANTFEEWLTTTSLLVAVANTITDGNVLINNLTVGGLANVNASLNVSGNIVASNITVGNLNASTGNITFLVGSANTAIYSNITSAIDSSIAFSIALG